MPGRMVVGKDSELKRKELFFGGPGRIRRIDLISSQFFVQSYQF